MLALVRAERKLLQERKKPLNNNVNLEYLVIFSKTKIINKIIYISGNLIKINNNNQQGATLAERYILFEFNCIFFEIMYFLVVDIY
jgi:hypothetical protein